MKLQIEKPDEAFECVIALRNYWKAVLSAAGHLEPVVGENNYYVLRRELLNALARFAGD